MTYDETIQNSLPEEVVHLQNGERTCDAAGTGLTQRRSRPVRGYVYFKPLKSRSRRQEDDDDYQSENPDDEGY